MRPTVRTPAPRTWDSVSLSLGQSDTALAASATGRTVTVSYMRRTDGFFSGASGAVTRLGTMPAGFRPSMEMRCPLVGDVYLAVGVDGFVGIYNNATTERNYGAGFGAVLTYAIA